jgi:hypothetical protein
MKNNSNSIVSHKDYVAGWFDSSIRGCLEHFQPSKSMDFALITSLDSNLDPSSLLGKSQELKSIGHLAKRLKKGILLPTAEMLEADADNQIFFGFDEVWFFPTDKIKPIPDAAWLVGPRRIDQRKLDSLGTWMVDNRCSLALGDGDGLNVIVKARGLIKHLIGYSLSQPQPTAGGEVEESSVMGMCDATR